MMIKKSLILFVVIFALYNLLCFSFPTNFVSPQGFWQENQIKAQGFMYSDTDSVESVIVGTSQSARILQDSLSGFVNLAFYGESIYNGLYLLKKKGVYPKWLFIETNIATQDNPKKDGFFYETLFNPAFYPTRRYLLGMRDGYQPLLLIASLIEKELVDNTIALDKRDKYAAIFHVFDEPSIDRPRYSAHKEGVGDNSTGYHQLAQYIDSMEAHGTKVVFFEMPTHDALCNSYRYETTRIAIEKAFPPSRYIYLPRVPCGEYKTLDGWHMGLMEAVKYTKLFRLESDSVKHLVMGL